ncbi:hypothetical protein M3204_14390 [Mesobacillus subterraneus]|uniref:hypothetical protein n=1 Tax=Mesobacillus subterraneus TaxID=285983 RepID=UPI00203E3091|nr:hypothetical protein [Mesobacillus subterraneus]MCM3665602.1 hypothetical protein [Mesobacillus subterraneus]MCM3684348.1 hypothetical protein [Mesobacillus subterraneus]
MTTFLLLLSLILNAAAIFAIILLYLRQNRLMEAEKKQQRIIKEIEEVFSAYLFELKEENDTFIEMMKKTNSASPYKQDGTADKDATSSTAKENTNELPSRIGKGVSYHAARKAYQQSSKPVSVKEEVEAEAEALQDKPRIPVSESEPVQLSFIDQVVKMKKQGLTIEEIARDLDKGKTEIELLLKFRQNTQE